MAKKFFGGGGVILMESSGPAAAFSFGLPTILQTGIANVSHIHETSELSVTHGDHTYSGGVPYMSGFLNFSGGLPIPSSENGLSGVTNTHFSGGVPSLHYNLLGVIKFNHINSELSINVNAHTTSVEASPEPEITEGIDYTPGDINLNMSISLSI